MNQNKLTQAYLAECRAIIKEGSKSFYLASLLLPSKVRLAATALYAFCRVSDDIADEPNADLVVVQKLRKRLEDAYAGKPHDHAADLAFAEVVSLYDIPDTVPLAMIEGFEWDVTGKEYNTISDVIDYSARVAGTVGVMMSIVMGRRSETTLARACDLGLAMQLINIARDVGEDARNGRVYLPSDWLKEEGIEKQDLLDNPVFTPALGRVVKRLLDLADEIYEKGNSGIVDLPASCRPGIRAAGLVYAEIGQKVRQNGYNSIDNRAYTSKGRKLGLILKSPGNPLEIAHCDPAPPMNEVRFLIDAAARESDEAFGDGEWLVHLFTELEKRDHAFLENARETAKLNVMNKA